MDPGTPVADATAPCYSLPSHDSRKSKWVGISSLGPVTNTDGESLPTSAQEAYLSFWGPTSPDDDPDLVLSSLTGAVVIENAVAWLFSVPPVELALAEGVWNWRFEVFDGDVLTPVIQLGIITVL